MMPRPTTGSDRSKQKPKLHANRLEFLYTFEFITQDEYQACLLGDAIITEPNSKKILNINAKLTFLPGETQILYMGRAIDVGVKQLLGLTDQD